MHAKNKECKVDVCAMVAAVYPKRNVDMFASDYARYVENLDTNCLFLRHHRECDPKECMHIRREYIQQRQNIYVKLGLTEMKAVVLCQMLDELHVAKYHLIDIGLRYKADGSECDVDNDEDEQKLADFDRTLAIMKAAMTTRRAEFRKIRGRDQSPNVLSKFVTETATQGNHADGEEKKSSESDNPMTHYSFGFRFAYWPFYERNENSRVMIPGTDLMEVGNSGGKYRLCDFFVAPSLSSIKAEVLNSADAPISNEQYKETLEVAKFKHGAFKREMRRADHVFESVYNVREGSVITLPHILAIILYTDYDSLSAAFSRSFRKMSVSETVDSVKRRHSFYAHWARALREAVECWGTSLEKAPSIKDFYHGLSQPMLFSNFCQSFHGPTSTTLQFEVAVTFSNQGHCDNGIVIGLKNNGSANSFFDCRRWSRFAAESEMLFVGGFNQMEICKLTVVGATLKLDRWIRSLRYLSAAFCGNTVSDKMTRSDARIARLLVAHAMNDENQQNDNGHTIPIYVKQLFRNMLDSLTKITFDVGYFSSNAAFNDMAGNTRYGFKIISDIR